MNGASLQAQVAAQLQGVGETLTITRASGSPSSFSVVAVVSLAAPSQISELSGSAATSRPVLVITLDGTQAAVKQNDTFSHDGKTYSIQQPVSTLIGASVITRQAACL